jgi:hypothetical protein
MTIIEIRPFRNGWSVFEAPGVEPVFLNQEDAISYAEGRACFRSGEIRIVDASGAFAVAISDFAIAAEEKSPPNCKSNVGGSDNEPRNF